MFRLFFIVLYWVFHVACSFDWRESIAWRDSYAELSSFYALTGFALPSWSTKISEIHVDADDYRYYIDFSTDFERLGLPMDYIVAMRVWQANPLERMLLWDNLTLNHTNTSLHIHHRLSYPYALSLQNEIHVLSLVQSRLRGMITSDHDTTVNNRRLERVMCGMIVTVFKQMETILRDLDNRSWTSAATINPTTTTSPNDSPVQTLLRVVATIIPTDDDAYRVLRSSFIDYVNVQLQPLFALYQHQQREQEQSSTEDLSSSSKVTILEEVKVNESFYQEEVIIRILEASFLSIPRFSSSTSNIASSTIEGTNRTPTQNQPTSRYKVRGLLASPASVNVTMYLNNFQQLMMGGFKSVQLWHCQEQEQTHAVDASPPSSSLFCVFVPNRKVLFARYHRVMVVALAFSPLQRNRVETGAPSSSSSSSSSSLPPPSSLHQERMLCLGIGGGELISFLQHNHPYLSIDAIDIDTNVVNLARRWFDYRDDDEYIEHRHDDGNGNHDGDGNSDDNDGNVNDKDHRSAKTKHSTNRPHTILTDAWTYLHTVAANISSDVFTNTTSLSSSSSSSPSSSSSESPSSSSLSTLYYDYILIDLFTAECTRPDNNDTNVHGLSDPHNLAHLAAVLHPSHGITILHIHRNDQWEGVYYQRIKQYFKTIWLLRSVTSAIVVAAHFDKDAWMPGLDGTNEDMADREVMINGETSRQPLSTSPSPSLIRWHSWHDPCVNLIATSEWLEYHSRWHHHHAMITMGDRFGVDCL